MSCPSLLSDSAIQLVLKVHEWLPNLQSQLQLTLQPFSDTSILTRLLSMSFARLVSPFKNVWIRPSLACYSARNLLSPVFTTALSASSFFHSLEYVEASFCEAVSWRASALQTSSTKSWSAICCVVSPLVLAGKLASSSSSPKRALLVPSQISIVFKQLIALLGHFIFKKRTCFSVLFNVCSASSTSVATSPNIWSLGRSSSRRRVSSVDLF